MLDLLSIATDGVLSSVVPAGTFVGPVPLQLASLGYLYPVISPGFLPPPRRRVGGSSGGLGKKTYEDTEERKQYTLSIRTILSAINGKSYVEIEDIDEYKYSQTDAHVKTLSIVKNDVGYDITVFEMLANAAKPNVLIDKPLNITPIKPAISSSLGKHKTIYDSMVKAKVLDVTKKQKK